MSRWFAQMWSRLVMSGEERNLLQAMYNSGELLTAVYRKSLLGKYDSNWDRLPHQWVTVDYLERPSKESEVDATRRLYHPLPIPSDEDFKELDFALSGARYADALLRLEANGHVRAVGTNSDDSLELYVLTAAGLETAMELWNSDEGGHRLSAQETPDENVEG